MKFHICVIEETRYGLFTIFERKTPNRFQVIEYSLELNETFNLYVRTKIVIALLP